MPVKAALRVTQDRVLVGETSKAQHYERGVSREKMTLKGGGVEADGEAIASPSEASALLRECSLAAGMHPDNAAEPIIDFALRYGKPFAIVPCCTCSKDFPKRTLRGKLVKSYEDFVEYLSQKDPRIQVSVLDMEGKNRVLYMTAANHAEQPGEEAKRAIQPGGGEEEAKAIHTGAGSVNHVDESVARARMILPLQGGSRAARFCPGVCDYENGTFYSQKG